MKKIITIMFMMTSLTMHAVTSTINLPDLELSRPTALRLAGLGYVGTGLSIVAATTASALVTTHKKDAQQQSPSSWQTIAIHLVAATIGGGLSWYGTSVLAIVPDAPKN